VQARLDGRRARADDAAVRLRLHTCGLVAVLAGCNQPIFLMFEEHLETPDGERLVGSGCESIGDGTSGSGSAGASGPTYSIVHQGHDGEGVRVLVRSGTGRLLEVRDYNEDFLRSGNVDEFEIEFPGQHTLRLRYWGGDTCEEPREPGVDASADVRRRGV
jgi:hypothetical protein